jgi:hypothetical protein
VTGDDLRHYAQEGGAELHVRDDRAWVVVVGTVDAARASAAAELIDDLVWKRSFHRVSVDLTCALIADQGAATTFDALRAGAAAWLDVTAPSVWGWGQHAA